MLVIAQGLEGGMIALCSKCYYADQQDSEKKKFSTSQLYEGVGQLLFRVNLPAVVYMEHDASTSRAWFVSQQWPCMRPLFFGFFAGSVVRGFEVHLLNL